MSIEHENFDNILQHKDENDLEQYGVWVKKTPEEALAAEVHEDETDSSAFFIDDLDFAEVPDIDSDSFDNNLNDKIDEALESVEDEQPAAVQSTTQEDTLANEDFTENLIEEFDAETVSAKDVFAMDDSDSFIPADNPESSDTIKTAEENTADISDTIDIDIEEYMPAEPAAEPAIADEPPLDMDLHFEDNFEQITPDFPEESPQDIEVSEFISENNQDISDKVESIDFGEIEEIDSNIFDIPEFSENAEIEKSDTDGSELESPQTEKSDIAIENVDISAFETEEPNDIDTAPPQTGTEEQIYNIAVKADDESESSEDAQPVQTDMHMMSASLLEKIMGELSLLRKDITDLKSDLTSLKSGVHSDSAEKTDEEAAEQKADSGFFADDGEDDTIALSGDELNNILTSADFTSEDDSEKKLDPAAEAPDTDADESALPSEPELPAEPTIDETDLTETSFDGPQSELTIEEHELQEPQLDDIDFDMDETADEELPSEIEIPVIEDLVVDSSTDDFFAEDDNPKEIDETAMNFLAENPQEEPAEAEDAADIEEADEAEDAADIEEAEKSETDFDLPVESEEDIKEESNQYSPVNAVFNSKQWQSEEELEAVDDETAEKKPETVFGKHMPAQSASDTPVHIPHNMREDIKSVLAYMDQLLENLPEEKIVEFAQSEYFPVYKKLFADLGLS
ncbi:hypothetical protein H0R92_10470 [Treponema sp. OMZ 840]|uniref:hypothetical protein n=1 Tax=Treponema sp. OMZ 840 TaxID=244313 RepID=UPI003D931D21